MNMVMTVIVPVELREQAEAMAAQLSSESDGPAFVVDLSATGEPPVTHIGCQPIVTEAMAAQMQALTQIPEWSTAIVSACDGSDYLGQFDAIARSHGLQRIQEVHA